MVLNLFKFLQPPKNKKRKSFASGTVKAQTVQNIQREWSNIEVLLKGKQSSQLKQALISADKTLDNALRDVIVGENMGERLKNAQNLFDKNLYNKIWSAHKMRNSLVHESGYEPPYHMIEKGVKDFKRALSKLGVRLP